MNETMNAGIEWGKNTKYKYTVILVYSCLTLFIVGLNWMLSTLKERASTRGPETFVEGALNPTTQFSRILHA